MLIRTLPYRFYCCLFPFFALAAASADQQTEIATAMDSVLSPVFPADEPGAAVLVAKQGEIIFRKGYGLANLEHRVPATPDTVFRIASMTKQFTGVAILLLVEEGKLKLDDPITKFLPDYPAQGRTITVAHLLGHQSGLFDYMRLPEFQRGRREEITLQELIAVFKDRPLEFEPGQRMEYCNSGYILLGAIIEKVSGKTYAEFVEDRLLRPAGMRDSRADHERFVIPNRASGYVRDGGGFANAPFVTMTEPHAAGVLVSTANDMFLWDQALYAGKIIKRETLGTAFTPFKLRDGSPTDAGCGWGLSELRGARAMIHSGVGFGFWSYGLTMPESRIFVILLSNGPGRRPGPSNLAAQLAAIALGEPYEKPKAVELTDHQLESLVGKYSVPPEPLDRSGGQAVEIRRQETRLTLLGLGPQPMELRPASEAEFYVMERFPTRIIVTRSAGGAVTGFVLDRPLGPPLSCVRVEPGKPPPATTQSER